MTAPQQTGLFDIIGDVHGCYPELLILLEQLGYQVHFSEKGDPEIIPPDHRRLIFVGDLVDRGPDTPAVLKLVMRAVKRKVAFCVIGNHDDKLMRKLAGRNVQVNHGLDVTMDQLKGEPKEFLEHVRDFLESIPYYLWIDQKKLLVVHAGLAEKYHGLESNTVRDLSMFGPTTGKLDAYGLPSRVNWAKDYNGEPLIIFGHTPVREPVILNNTINIDTGCVFGGKLTALRYPEMEFVSVKPAVEYTPPRRPF